MSENGSLMGRLASAMMNGAMRGDTGRTPALIVALGDLLQRSDRRSIGELLMLTQEWNGGLGLLVPRHMALLLRELGFKTGYTDISYVKGGQDGR